MLSLGLARLRRLAPDLQDHRPLGDRRRADGSAGAGWWRRKRAGSTRPGWSRSRAAPSPTFRSLRPTRRIPWAGHAARYAIPDIYRQLSEHRTTLLFVNTRSQAEMLFQELWSVNEDNLPIALHHGSLDVAPAPQGGGGDGGEPAARRRRHLDARSRHRLGRCRSRHPCRRAEGREPACPAHRPRQSPHGRTVEGDPGAGQPLRGDGMPGSTRRQLHRRAGHAAARIGRARRAGPARARHGLRRTLRSARTLRRDHQRRPLCRSLLGDLRAHRRFRRDRRLCAANLRALRAYPQDGGRALARLQSASGAAISPQSRHHRRSADAEYPPRQAQRPGLARARRRDRSARWRNIFWSSCRRATRFFSPARCCASKAFAKTNAMPARPSPPIRGYRPTCRRQVSALDLSRRPGARHARRPRPLAAPARAGARLAGHPGRKVPAAETRRTADRDFSARQSRLHGRLSLRGAAGAPDARHAAHPPARARRRQAARLRRHRLCARRSGAWRTWGR